jgi:hypothetical protein
MSHPRRAARDPLKGAALAARLSRFRGALGRDISLRRAGGCVSRGELEIGFGYRTCSGNGLG